MLHRDEQTGSEEGSWSLSSMKKIQEACMYTNTGDRGGMDIYAETGSRNRDIERPGYQCRNKEWLLCSPRYWEIRARPVN